MKTYKTSAYLDKLLNSRTAVTILWFGMAFYGFMQAVDNTGTSNYIIYKYVFIHASHSKILYLPDPAQGPDVNIYGPLFSVIIAPFTLLPDKAGAFCWVMLNALFLYWSLLKLPLPNKWKNILMLLSSQELMITSGAYQTNAFVCSCIILGFCYIRKEKEGWALFFIMLATFVKIYGITALAFFFLSKRKVKFIVAAITWSVVLFFAPLLIVNFNFLLQSYKDWYAGLKIKAAKNILPGKEILFQNVSVPGMLRRILFPRLLDWLVLLPAACLFISQYLQLKFRSDLRYQLYLLCSVLIATVIFSTGSESATYIIAVPGMVIWYLLQPKTKFLQVFFWTAFILTSFSYSDILTSWSRTHLYRPYSLKAFFPFVIWIIIVVQIYTKQFLKAINPFKLIPL